MSLRPGLQGPTRHARAVFWVLPLAAVALLAGYAAPGAADAPSAHGLKPWYEFLPGYVIAIVACLLGLSAFFSSCETAFLSIQKTRLRGMREEESFTARWVVRMLDDPARLLTTILVGNMLVNTLTGVVLGTRVKDLFEFSLGMPAPAAYALAIGVTTLVLLFFGEITPKVFAVRARETYARWAVVPLIAADSMIAPVRKSLLRLTDFLFQITRFHELRAAPFITEDELKAAIADEQTHAVIEEEGREMIRRILEFRDVQLSEILVPRPDIVALPEDATVAEAHALFREYEYSRIPIFDEDLDHITGILSVKDLIPRLSENELSRPVKAFVRPPHFVPATVSVQDFIKEVQRLRAHLAIVVDEYGGTKGIVTLHDAIEQVVGDIRDEDDDDQPEYEQLGEGVYRVKGSLSLDDLSALIHVTLDDEEHNTVSGFVMHLSEKVLAVGDQIRYEGILFTVEKTDGNRATTVRLEVPHDTAEDAS